MVRVEGRLTVTPVVTVEQENQQNGKGTEESNEYPGALKRKDKDIDLCLCTIIQYFFMLLIVFYFLGIHWYGVE